MNGRDLENRIGLALLRARQAEQQLVSLNVILPMVLTDMERLNMLRSLDNAEFGFIRAAQQVRAAIVAAEEEKK